MENKRHKASYRYALVILIAAAIYGTIVFSFSSDTAIAECELGDGIRPLYFECEEQKEVFKNLPKMPKDFFQFKNTFLYGFVTFNEKALNRSYWLQPEWFPNFQMAGGSLQSRESYNGRDIVLWNAGIYPSDFYAKTSPGRSIKVYTWIGNIPIQWKKVGIQLRPAFPTCDSYEERGFSLGENRVCQDADYAEKHFKLSISPDLFILEPSYPSYHPGHRKIIEITINVSEDIEEGIYIVGFDVTNPPRDFNEKQYSEYGFMYTGSPREFHVANPSQYRLFIDVEKTFIDNVVEKLGEKLGEEIAQELKEE